MSIINRRNAIFGWAAWAAGKRLLSWQAKRAAGVGGGGRAWIVRIGAGLGAVAGAAWLVRRLTGGDEAPDE